MLGDSIPDILPSNLLKLKAAYRHPFEYINPRLYQKRKYKSADPVDETTNAKFFVDNEEEFEALQDHSTQEISAQEISGEASPLRLTGSNVLWKYCSAVSPLYLP